MSEPILSVTSELTYVVIRIRLEWVDTFAFRFDAGSAWAAKLLCSRIHDVLGRAMTEARLDAYRDGWKHAKAKTSKLTWQTPRLP